MPDDDEPRSISALASRRRATSHRRLEAEGIPLPSHLPPIVDEDGVRLRPADQVARRALALFLVALRAETLAEAEQISPQEMEESQPVGFAALSPQERAFMLADDPSERETVEMSWRYESLQTLLWALGLVQLPPATEIADVPELVGLVLEADEEQLVASASLRLPAILLDALDLHFHYHWAVRQAARDRKVPPGGLDPGVVLERHYALNWLTHADGEEWDEVDTVVERL